VNGEYNWFDNTPVCEENITQLPSFTHKFFFARIVMSAISTPVSTTAAAQSAPAKHAAPFKAAVLAELKKILAQMGQRV
jgi:hypothetical protein